MVFVIVDTQNEILVHIRFNDDKSVSSSDETEYMSNIYSKLWDEMIIVKNLGLSCIVVSNKVTSLDEFISNRIINAVYDSQLDPSKYSRNLPNVSIENLNSIRNIWQEQINSYNVIYYDQRGSFLPTFSHVAVGGTFDKLHNGHRKLLTLACLSCKYKLTIGITSDVLLQHKAFGDKIESFDLRKKLVENFVRTVNPHLSIEFSVLIEPYGPAITDESIEAIVVSSETVSGAIKINEIRKELNMIPLSICVSRRCDAATLSSTFIRSQCS